MNLTLSQIAMIVFFVCAGLIYLTVTFAILQYVAGISALLAALFIATGK